MFATAGQWLQSSLFPSSCNCIARRPPKVHPSPSKPSCNQHFFRVQFFSSDRSSLRHYVPGSQFLPKQYQSNHSGLLPEACSKNIRFTSFAILLSEHTHLPRRPCSFYKLLQFHITEAEVCIAFVDMPLSSPPKGCLVPIKPPGQSSLFVDRISHEYRLRYAHTSTQVTSKLQQKAPPKPSAHWSPLRGC